MTLDHRAGAFGDLQKGNHVADEITWREVKIRSPGLKVVANP
jgi:hypothetical protein